MKKIRLRTSQSDQKIFREVDTLSRLNHRYIVRYYTTWIETSDHVSTATSAVGSSATAARCFAAIAMYPPWRYTRATAERSAGDVTPSFCTQSGSSTLAAAAKS